MKTSSTNQSSATSRFDPSHCMRGIVIACAVACAATVAQTATAGQCPPGYGGIYPHCRPVPPHRAQPQKPLYMKTVVPHPGGVVPITPKHHSYPIERKIADPHKLPPHVGPGPIEHQASASSAHGKAFVGGHSQSRIDHGNAALNPQPIPPGHALHSIPHHGAPIEKKISH